MKKWVNGKRILRCDKPYFEIGLVVLLFLISILIYLSCITNKLSKEEYETVSSLYTEINMVDKGGKSDFYVNNLLKVLDKTTVLNNLRKDSLQYTIVVSENMMNMLTEGYDIKSVLAYVNRCNLNFNDFKKLELNSELFNLNIELLNRLNVGDTNVEDFVTKSYKLIAVEQNDLSNIKNLNIVFVFCYVACFCGLGCLFVYIRRRFYNERDRK